MPAIMFQGTGSNVGKSVLVAGLCRAAVRRGLRVAPFKPQNMSNNAAVTEDGGEIGRAQALQARACRVASHTDMNPVLLKPETETGAQVIVQGKRLSSLTARDYTRIKPQLMPDVLESFNRLTANYDLVLVEGSYGPQHVLEAVPISLVVYVETPLLQRLIKRLWRDVRDRQRPASYVIRQMLREMLPGERRFIHPLKRRADLVVRGYNFDLEPILSRIG